jgi:siroheme synthase-like protein
MSRNVFPIALLLEGRSCLVVGSGPELSQRTQALLDVRARPCVVSSAPPDEIRTLARSGALELREREFQDSDLDGKWLAVLVDESPLLARRMAQVAEAACVFFCAVDQPEHNSYAHMAQARAGLLTVAISTAGRAPALGRKLRQELERLLASSKMGAFVEKLATLRDQTPSADRRRVLGDAVSGVHFTGELKLG